MTTLAALTIGLLALVLLVGVGLTVLARSRRRSRASADQPRTVADLVRMREAAREVEQPGETAPEPVSVSTEERATAGATAEPTGAEGSPPWLRLATAEPVPVTDERPEAEGAQPSELVTAEPVTATAEPEDAGQPTPGIVDTPWVRAARMADPLAEWTPPSAGTAKPRTPEPPPARPAAAAVPSPRSGRGRRRPFAWGGEPPQPPQASVGGATALSAVVAVAAAPREPAGPDDTATAAAEQAAAPASMPGPTSTPPREAASAPEPEQASESMTAPDSTPGPITEPAAVPVTESRSACVPAAAPARASGPALVPTLQSLVEPVRELTAAPSPRPISAPTPASGRHLVAVAPPAGASTPEATPEQSEAAPEPSDAAPEPVDAAPEPSDVAPEPVDAAHPGPASQRVSASEPAAGVGSADTAAPADTARSIDAEEPVVPAAPVDTVESVAAVESVAVVESVAAAEPVDAAEPDGADRSSALSEPARAVVPIAATEPSARGAANGGGSPERARSHNAPSLAASACAPTNGHVVTPTPARVAGRVRRTAAETAAEQEAADLALLRTFGIPQRRSDEAEVALAPAHAVAEEPVEGAAQPVGFQVVGRDGKGVGGASVTLLDDHARETATTLADPDGRGTLTAHHPGGYMLVTAAEGYQPGAITIAVTDGPLDIEIPLTRSASIAGTVSGEDGPVVGAQVALVQDGEVVDTTESAADGTYRFADLAADEYGLSVTAVECEPVAVVVRLLEETDLRHDVDLEPAGLPA